MGQRSYSLSWAPVLSVALPSPFVPLLYHTLRGLSRGIFAFAGLFLLGVPHHPSWCPLRGLPLDCSYIVPHLEWFVKGFLHFFSSAISIPMGRHLMRFSLPLTMIVYHTPLQKSTWQSAQIRASKLFDFCTTFLLTNCWRYGIMEIPAPTSEGAAPKIEIEKATPCGVAFCYRARVALTRSPQCCAISQPIAIRANSSVQ